MSQHPISEAGRHLSDAVREAHTRGGEGRWIAARLEDGRTDGVLYDTKADAVRLTGNRGDDHAYLRVPPGQMPPAEATGWLDLHRRMYAAGMDLRDPDRDVIMPVGPLPRRSPGAGLLLPDRPDVGGLIVPNRSERRRRRSTPWRHR